MANTRTTSSYHDRRLARRLEDPEYREHFERAYREITTVDAIVNILDSLRSDHGMSKAELARRIEKNPASVRRLLTASGNPELRTVVAIADALNADVKIVPRRRRASRATRGSSARSATARSGSSPRSATTRSGSSARSASRSRRGSKSRGKNAVES